MPGVQLKVECMSHAYTGINQGVQALDRVSFTVEPGQSLAVVGPSGSGKSTLLLLLAGLLTPTSGRILINEAQLTTQRKRTALILQDFGLMPWKTVVDNVALGLLIRHVRKEEAYKRAHEALKTVGLQDYAKVYPAELSGGMKQRVALARALTLSIDLLLLDEPFSALDEVLREGLQDLLVELQKKHGYTQVIVTHSIDEAVLMGDAIMVMSAQPGNVVGMVEGLSPEKRLDRGCSEAARVARVVRSLLINSQAGSAHGNAPGKPRVIHSFSAVPNNQRIAHDEDISSGVKESSCMPQ